MNQNTKEQRPAPAGNIAEAIDPTLPIVDCHHHLWHPHADRYLADAFQKEITNSGHNVVATVYAECSVMYRQSGPKEMRTLGEAEFAAGMAAMADSGMLGSTRICAGYIGAVDLMLGDGVGRVLDAMEIVSGGRLRGIRGTANWDPDSSVNSGTRPMAPQGLLLDARFRAGIGQMIKRGLVYDAWQYHPQIPDFCSLADAFPHASIVLDHCGGLLGVAAYATPDNFNYWKGLMAEVAKRPNVTVKLGGLSGPRCGFSYHQRSTPATLEDIVVDWRPYIETCIDLFGADRCMFESNFPVDKVSGSYQMLWNVFKTITSHCSPDEKTALFSGNAMRVYRID